MNHGAQVRLAETLLDEKILRPSDWKGEIGPSIMSGMDRWLGEMGMHGQKGFDAGMILTQDAHEIEYDAQSWARVQEVPSGGTIGAIVLCSGSGCIWTVGDRIQELERMHAGLGYSVLGLIDGMLSASVGCGSPSWGFDQVEWRYDGAYEDYEDAEDEAEDEKADDHFDWVTLENYRRLIPAPAITAKYRPGVMAGAAKRSAAEDWGRTAPWAQEILDTCRTLARMQTPRNRSVWGGSFECMRHFDNELCKPILIRWSDNDLLLQIYDDHHESLMNAGIESWDVFWIRPFQTALSSGPGSAQAAVRALRETLRIMVLVSQLLMALDSPGDRTLLEVLT